MDSHGYMALNLQKMEQIKTHFNYLPQHQIPDGGPSSLYQLAIILSMLT